MDMISMPALAVAAAAMVPLMCVIAWIDLTELRIPNWSVLAILGIFLVTGVWGLPFDTFLWRLLYGAIALGLGLLLYAVAEGIVGGGDLKMVAALVPFFRPADTGWVLMVFALLCLLAIVLFAIVRSIARGRQTGSAAIDQQRAGMAMFWKLKLPVGLVLGVTATIYLCLEVAASLA